MYCLFICLSLSSAAESYSHLEMVVLFKHFCFDGNYLCREKRSALAATRATAQRGALVLTCLFPTCHREILMVAPINSDIAFSFFITKVTLLQVYIRHANRNETIKRITIIIFAANLRWSCSILVFFISRSKTLEKFKVIDKAFSAGKTAKRCFFIFIIKYTCKIRPANQLILFSASLLLHLCLNEHLLSDPYKTPVHRV